MKIVVAALATTLFLGTRFDFACGRLIGGKQNLGIAAENSDAIKAKRELQGADVHVSSSPFYAIAHMTNSKNLVNWAVREGANAIEVDLRFDKITQEPIAFQHSVGSQACDCTCYFPILPFLSTRNVCKYMDEAFDGGGVAGCKTSVSAADLMMHIATKNFALVIIDSKVSEGDYPQDKLEGAGRAVVRSLERNLFKMGYQGDIIIGAPYLDQFKYIEGAALEASNSAYKHRIYFTIDGEEDNAVGVLSKLIELPSKNRVYGTGISACSPATHYEAILTGKANQISSVIGMTYVWTVDKDDSMDDYISRGANGILTNYPRDAVEAAARHGLALARPGVRNQIPTATSDQVKGAPTDFNCDCDYHPGGCKISSKAPDGWACKCSYKGGWTCGGDVVLCKDESSTQCKAPDESFESCLQGGGDCEAYSENDCDCDYSPGGCKISKPAPENFACKCSYKGAWTCGGDIVACANKSSQKCRSPDASFESCLQGGGDCEAYSSSNSCDCDYDGKGFWESGGCKISTAAPPFTACKCEYKGAWTCGGKVVRCVDENANKCANPDKSKEACLLASHSDCDGY